MSPKKQKTRLPSNFGIYFIFSIIILISLILRLYQPDWYNDRQFHPDERWIVGNAVPSLNYPGRPLGLQYGSLPLYILSFYKNFINDLRNNGWMKNLDTNRALIGGARVISGLVDTGTIVLIFLSALLLFKPVIALVASVLLAFTTLHIHAAHFFTVDTFVTFFVVATFYFSARIYKKGQLIDYILAGVMYGAAIASKTAALPAALVILTGHLLYFFSIKGKGKTVKDEKINSWINLGIAAAVSFIAFFIFMPYAIIDFRSFMNDQNYQRRILVTGEGDVPYNRQYLYTTPYFYYIYNLVLYTMGIPFGLTAFFAFLYYIIFAGRNLIKLKFEGKEIILILSWMLPYFLIVGNSFGKFNRYMLPFTPFLALITAKFLYDLFFWLKDKKWAFIISGVVISGAAFYGIAFMNVYTNSHTWIQASRWIYRNVPEYMPDKNPPQKTVILNEMWGDDLPVYADGKGGWIYNITKWNVQEPDSPTKIEELSMRLNEADFVAMADKRAYGTYLRLPKRYPINYFYYSTMMKEPEKLGFKLVYEKAVYPSFLGITIKDDKADESFQLYDHPHVYIFKNEKYLSKDELRTILIEGERQIREKFGTSVSQKIKGALNPNIGLLRDKPVAILPVISIFMWYLLVQFLSFMIFPLHFNFLNNFSDKGYGLSKISGVFIFAWINWIIVSIGLIRFYQINLFVLFFVFLILSIILYKNIFKQVNLFIKQNKNHILITEIVFLASYLFFIIIKLWAPDIHNVAGHGYNGGGEPMGMAYLSGIYNDVKFPPHDPWLSGWTLNYYYWGQLMLATLSKLLGYEPRITYNLSLSLLFALCCIGAFTLVYNMTKKYSYALFGSFLLALSGNFHTLEFILDKLVNANNIGQFINSVGVFQFIWDPTRIYPTPVITEMPFFSYLYGDLHAHNIVIPVTVFGFALIYNVILQNNKTFNLINSLGDSQVNKILSFFAIALVLGAMIPMNTWNYPPVLLLVSFSFLIIAFNLYRENFKSKKKIQTPVLTKNILLSTGIALAVILAVAIIAYILFIPFHQEFQSPYKTQPQPISKAERVSLYVMFKYFSIFFFIVFAYIYFILNNGFSYFIKKLSLTKIKIKNINFDKIMQIAEKIMDKINSKMDYAFKFYAFLLTVVLFLIIFGFIQETFAFLFVMVVVVLWVLFSTKDRTEIFSLVLLFISIGIIWGTEIYFIADGRMNTVFKFYMVAWTMLSIAIPYLFFKVIENIKMFFKLKNQEWLYIFGVAFGLLVISIIARFVDLRSMKNFLASILIIVMLAGPIFIMLKEKFSKYIFIGSFIFLLIPAILYPVLGAIIKMDICSLGFKQKPRIDGVLYMKDLEQRFGSVRDFDKYDYQTIEWINKNFKNIDPILETHGEWMYTGSSRISIFTGMPTFVGWGYQVSQQSGRSGEVLARTRLTEYIYNANDLNDIKRVLKEYGLKYFYIGTMEKKLFPNCYKLAEIGDAVYQNAGATLYKVKE